MKKYLAAGLSLAFVLGSAGSAMAYEQQDLVDRYSTLSGALINLQAGNQKMSLGDYLGNTKATIYSLPESPGLSRLSLLSAPGSNASAGTRLQAATLPELNRQLLGAGLGLSSSDYNNVESLAEAVKAKSSSVDAQVIGAGALWASKLSTLSAPAISTPNAGAGPALPEVPAGALSFGLLLNKGLTQMAMDSPKIFSQVAATGVGTDEANSAWKSAFSKAYDGSQQDLSQVVPDACTGGLLSVAVSGDPASADAFGDCGQGCKATGQYLHAQVDGMFSTDDQENRFRPLENPTLDGNTKYEDLDQILPSAMRVQPNNSKNYGEDLDKMLINNQSTCQVGSAATKSAMEYALPDVWGGLSLD